MRKLFLCLSAGCAVFSFVLPAASLDFKTVDEGSFSSVAEDMDAHKIYVRKLDVEEHKIKVAGRFQEHKIKVKKLDDDQLKIEH